MDEDEAINQANTLLKAMRNASERNLNSILFDASITRSDIKAIQTIIDLYNKEKEKNKELEEKLKAAKQLYNDSCICIATECVGKDKIRELEDFYVQEHKDKNIDLIPIKNIIDNLKILEEG